MKAMQLTRTSLAGIALAAAVLLQPPAFAQAPAHPVQGHAMAASSPARGGGDMEATMKNMSDAMMAIPQTGNTDVDFARMMRVHHLGAIRMAEVEVRDGKDAGMRQMARKMIADQTKEVAQLERFLAKHGQPIDPMKK
jgi:uncharacterized protein (DUF305 family)